MNKIRLAVSSLIATVLAACTVEGDETLICHFPDTGSEEYEILSVGSDALEDYIYDEGALCYGGTDDVCYEPDFDSWEEGGELCPS